MSKNNSVLVVFTKELPKKNQNWWQQFDTIITPKSLESAIQKLNLSFVDIDSLIDPGSVHEAAELTRKLSLLRTSDGRRLSKVLNYKGFELWWMHYDDLMYKFCLPYTQYQRLLKHLVTFSEIHLYRPPFPDLFRHFLDSYGCQYRISDKFKRGLSLGILFQVILSTSFLLWAKVRGPKLMVWTSDQFSPDGDYDFRMKFIYEELRKREINFIEFVRSMESSTVVFQHALRRKRPVIYSYAIVTLARFLASLFRTTERTVGVKQDFWFRVADNYLENVRGDIWAIRALMCILKFLGINSVIIPGAASRNFPELLACKLCGIPTTGIQHGASLKYHSIWDYMPEFDGQKSFSIDKYGLWSDWWKEYYVKNSKVYKPEQLHVSGPMRPLEKENSERSDLNTDSQGLTLNSGPIKVLFVSEQLAAPAEVLPLLEVLMKVEGVSLYLKFRSYSDGFEDWLIEHRPDVLERFNPENILKGSVHEALAQCDVAVGTMSAGVLEALLELKPFIFFHTKKWGDYFELKSFDSPYKFFAEDPKELVDLVLKSREVPKDTLKELQNRFFGDPYKNGSKWVVEQAERLL